MSCQQDMPKFFSSGGDDAIGRRFTIITTPLAIRTGSRLFTQALSVATFTDWEEHNEATWHHVCYLGICVCGHAANSSGVLS